MKWLKEELRKTKRHFLAGLEAVTDWKEAKRELRERAEQERNRGHRELRESGCDDSLAEDGTDRAGSM